MGTVIAGAARWMAYVSAGGAAVMALMVSVDVVRRMIEGRGFRGVIDLTVLLLVVIAFGGFAQAEVDGSHVRMTLLTSRLGARTRQAARSLSMLVTLLFVVGLAYATGVRALASWRTGEATIGLIRFPIWPSRTLIAVGCLALAVVVTHKSLTMARQAVAPGRAPPGSGSRGEPGIAEPGTGGL